MKHVHTAAAAALIANLLASATPTIASAAIVGVSPELDAACAAVMKPDPASGYETLAVNVASTTTSDTVDTGPATYAGVGPSSQGAQHAGGPAHINGKSPNIFGYAYYDVVYLAGATATYPTLTTVTTVTSGDCHVHKPVSGRGTGDDTDHPGYQNAPPGLQSTDPVSITSVTTTVGTRTETVAGPWIDPSQTIPGGEIVICISPGSKDGGVWGTQNGYVDGSLGTCSTEWYTALGGVTPSVSLPKKK